MDFQNIKWVIIWQEPHSFLSLVQKIGQCAQNLDDVGEAIFFVMKSTCSWHVVDFDRDKDDEDPDEEHEEIEVDHAIQPLD